ncbi:MAG: alcohol acetyltransferase [Symploca sp. SIO2G7]|nr:alcohol acetyltransferase [Symploca sp. SIO2G7]
MNGQVDHNYFEYCEFANRVARTSNVITISRIRGPLTEAVLSQALTMAQKRHPCLNYRIGGSSNSLILETEGTSKIPLFVLRGSHSDRWQDIALEEANKAINSSQALLRAVLFYPDNEADISYLITTIHHGIADALSNIQLHGDILTYCQDIVSGNPTEVSSLPVLPPIDNLMPESARGFKGKLNTLLFILQFGLKQLWYRPKILQTEQPLPSLELCRSGYVNRQLDERFTQNLVDCCKREKVSTHVALCTAMMLSLARKIESNTQNAVSMSCCTTISLRKSLEQIIGREHIGMLSSCIISHQTLRPNKSFWELARGLKQKLQYRLMEPDPFIQLLMTSRKMAESFVKNPNKVMSLSVLAGSLQANIPESYGEFELEEIHLTAAAAVHGGTLCVGAIAFRKKLSLNFFYSESSISRHTMESLADSVVFYLSEACKQKLEPTLV